MKSNLQILLTSVRKQNSRWGHSFVAAFTSSVSGEGVSFVVSSFAFELAKTTHQRLIITDSETLQRVRVSNKSHELFVQSQVPNLYFLEPEFEDMEEPDEVVTGQELELWNNDSKVERAIRNLQALRYEFDIVLIDCDSIDRSADAALLAPAADGVVLVVEANKTRRGSVSESIKTINLADGNLLGCVMNRRRYPIPNWIYQRL